MLIVGKRHYITGLETCQHFKHIVNNMTGLGFTGDDVGTYSIRFSLAMALYLAQRPVTTIMLLGRWCSDTFLLYIRRQVQGFSPEISADMISHKNFFTIPVLEESDRSNPCTWNSRSFASTISLNGPNVSNAHHKRPAIHICH